MYLNKYFFKQKNKGSQGKEYEPDSSNLLCLHNHPKGSW